MIHVYKGLWQSVVGEMLILRKEPTKERDRLAVCVQKDGQLVGHVPQNLTLLLFFLLDSDGSASKLWSRHGNGNITVVWTRSSSAVHLHTRLTYTILITLGILWSIYSS